MRCLARSRSVDSQISQSAPPAELPLAVYLDLPKVSVRPSGCLRQGWFAFLSECLTLRAAYAAYRATALLLGSRPAPAGTCSALRVSLCTAEDCHGYNKFSPWLCASVRAPSHFLPFAGPKPQKNLTPAIEQIPPTTTVGGTPTLLEPPPSAPLRVASLLRYAPVAPPWATHLSFPLDMRYHAGVRVIRGHLHPSGAALRAVCAASRRSNFVLFPHTCFGIRFADLWRRGWD
jgi:hypothetical protein